MIMELYMPCAMTEQCGKSFTIPTVAGKGFHRFLTRTYEQEIIRALEA